MLLVVDISDMTHTQGLSVLSAIRHLIAQEKGSAGLVGLKASVSSDSDPGMAHGWTSLAEQATFDHVAVLDMNEDDVSSLSPQPVHTSRLHFNTA